MSLLSLGAFDVSDFCYNMKDLLRIVGWILVIFKFAIPILIIALGAFDFGKAVVAEKEDEIKKQTKRLIYRVVAGVLIFLLPNIILFIFKVAVPGYETDKGQFDICEKCVLYPSQCN